MLEKHPLITSIRALTIAIWCLFAVVGAFLVLAVWSQIQMRTWRSKVTSSRTQSAPAKASEMPYPSEDEFNSFNTLPHEQKVQHASVIVITRFQRQGDSLKAIISEVPKQRPGTTFYYSVGQEFTEVSAYQQAGTEYGDGDVVFLIGNPAQMVGSYSYSKDRIGGLGGMPLQTLRELAAKSK